MAKVELISSEISVLVSGKRIKMSDSIMIPDNKIEIPTLHRGMHYIEFTSMLSKLRETEMYLEVGVQTGLLFSEIHARHAVGVDPNFNINKNIINNKKSVTLHHKTSDLFFRYLRHQPEASKGFDLSFLDGMHNFEFLLRDFYNTEQVSSRNGLIIIHDCLPLNEEMTHRDKAEAFNRTKNTAFPNYWTGDVWKIIPILKLYRSDLIIVYLDSPPTGLVCITNLDPGSEVLKKNYLDIVGKFKYLDSNKIELTKLYNSISIMSTSFVTNQHDHTLHFNI